VVTLTELADRIKDLEIARFFRLTLVKWHKLLEKPREGVIVYADGSDWDPGEGIGLYQYRAGEWKLIAMTSVVQTFSAGQAGEYTTLTSSSNSIAINLSDSNNFKHTLTENTTLAAPSSPVAGQAGVIQITQDSTARTLAFNSFWKWPGGTVGTVSTGSGEVDVISYVVNSSAAYATCVMLNDIS